MSSSLSLTSVYTIEGILGLKISGILHKSPELQCFGHYPWKCRDFILSFKNLIAKRINNFRLFAPVILLR